MSEISPFQWALAENMKKIFEGKATCRLHRIVRKKTGAGKQLTKQEDREVAPDVQAKTNLLLCDFLQRQKVVFF
jgi:hypothetical protein